MLSVAAVSITFFGSCYRTFSSPVAVCYESIMCVGGSRGFVPLDVFIIEFEP